MRIATSAHSPVRLLTVAALVCLGAVFAAAACTKGVATPAPATPSPVPAIPTVGSTTPSVTNVPPAVASAMGFLQERLQPSGPVVLTSFSSARWPDTSLGCPDAGNAYAQASTNGWTVALTADSASYEVHTDATGSRSVACTPLPVTDTGEINVATAAGIKGAIAVTIRRRDASTGVYQAIAEVRDPPEVAQFVSVLDAQVPFAPASGCGAIFQVVYQSPDTAVTFDYICAEDLRMLRGAQSFWAGREAQAPAQLGDLVGKYAGQVPFPVPPR